MIIKRLTINTQVVGGGGVGGGQERIKMMIKSLTINIKVGGQDKPPWTACPRLCNQAYKTERQGIQLNLTCIMTVIDATSYSDSFKQVK